MWEREIRKGDITVVQTVTEEGCNEFKILSKVSWPDGHREVERISNKVELIPNVEIMLEYCIELAEDAWSDTADKKLREIGFKICRDVGAKSPYRGLTITPIINPTLSVSIPGEDKIY